MKSAVVAAVVCALIFGLLASWLAPKMITEWFSPPVANGLDCVPSINYAMSRLVWTQLIASAVGALVGLVGKLMLGRKKPADTAPAKPA